MYSIIYAKTAIPESENVAYLKGVENLFGNFVEAILGVAAIVLFIMLIVGGFSLLTSGGNPKAAEAAKKTLTGAIAGIVIVALAYLILRFVGVLTGVDTTNFAVYVP